MKNTISRFHFANLVKVTRDFLGEHYAPLSESDCLALCTQTKVIDAINEALKKASIEGIKVQLNWSSDQGSTWTQYPKSH